MDSAPTSPPSTVRLSGPFQTDPRIVRVRHGHGRLHRPRLPVRLPQRCPLRVAKSESPIPSRSIRVANSESSDPSRPIRVARSESPLRVAPSEAAHILPRSTSLPPLQRCPLRESAHALSRAAYPQATPSRVQSLAHTPPVPRPPLAFPSPARYGGAVSLTHRRRGVGPDSDTARHVVRS